MITLTQEIDAELVWEGCWKIMLLTTKGPIYDHKVYPTREECEKAIAKLRAYHSTSRDGKFQWNGKYGFVVLAYIPIPIKSEQ